MMDSISLTGRQMSIARYVAAGYSNRDIASELKLSEQIVKNVVHSLFDKLGVWNRVELANYFSQAQSPEETALAHTRIEESRLAELRRRKILDTAKERVFDEIALLAANIFDVPIALVVLVDSSRVWFKSKVGLDVSDVPREITLCHHTIQQSKVFVVNDALEDGRFMCSPLVASEPGVRFYAAAPMITEDGYSLGVVCIVDRVPRQLTLPQFSILESLARLALEQIDLRARLAETNNDGRQNTQSDGVVSAAGSREEN